MTHRELAQIITPYSFSDVESNSSVGLRWVATNVVTYTDHGTYKLYLCHKRGLAIWIPTGDWFQSNQIPTAKQTIAQYAERRSKDKFRPRPYDRPGPVQVPHIQTEKSNQTHKDSRRNTDIALEPDLIKIRAEERRQTRLKMQRNTLPTTTTSKSDNRPSASTKDDRTNSMAEQKSPQARKPASIVKKNNNERWLAYKARRMAARIAAQRTLPVPQKPLEAVKGSFAQVVKPPTSLQQQQNSTDEISVLIDSGRIDGTLNVFSTANGSTISFGDFQPDGLDIDDLDLLEDN